MKETILVLSVVLSLCFTQGCGIKSTRFDKEHSSLVPVPQVMKSELTREMIEVMDYEDPGPNTNPRTGNLITPSPSPPTPAPEPSN